jgi:ubiquinone/menaquinone biosynthesis C-methylase UbiE
MIQALDRFRALADPTRMRIVALLRTMELAVGELAHVLGQSQPRVSRHVKILCDVGIAQRRREGSWVFLVPGAPDCVDPLFALIDEWQTTSPQDHWVIADAARLAAVRADRAAAAERYFSAHAGHWDAMRSLHVAESDVEAAMQRALDDAPIGVMIDIGTGTGRMIELFGAQASRATGIDRSPEMLRLARAKLAESPLTNWDLRQGDVAALPIETHGADTVILHQVLHFIPAPEAAIAEAARLVNVGGRLLIVDFAPHEREALRTEDAHARLGFSDFQIRGWCEAAGLQIDVIDELVGGELTVKIWRARRVAAPHLKVVAA